MTVARAIILAAALGAATAQAQTAPDASPSSGAPAAAPAPRTRAQPGRAHALPHAMTLPVEHVEGRLAYLRAELAITDAQAPAWDAFAAAAREAADSVRARMDAVAETGLPAAAPERARAMLDLLTARLDAARRVLDAGTTLYAALTPEQKRKADQLLAAPLARL